MKRNASRILSLVMAIALIMSLSLTAFALDGHEMYMSPAAGTSYTTMVDAATNTVILEVFFTAYNDGNYYNTGFDSDEQAAAVTWTVSNNDAGLVNGDVAVSAGSNNGYKTSKGTVTLNSGVSGVAVVHAAHNGLTLDLVIARDTATPVTSPSLANVYLVDASSSPANVMVNNVTATVYAPTVNPMSNLLIGKTGAFQNKPTAMGTLDALRMMGLVSSVTLSDTGDYANEINGLYYWSYAMYAPDGAIVSISQTTSASICELPATGYTVVWKYGAWSFASTLSEEITSWTKTN